MFNRSVQQQMLPSASTGQANDWKVLHEFSTILLQTGEIDSKLRQVLQTLSDFHGASSVVLSIHDPATGALYVRSSVGMANDALAGLNGIMPGEGACGRAFGNRERYIAEEFEKDPCLQPYLSWASRHRIGAVYASPFFDAKNETMGALSLYFDQARRPTEQEMQLADMCAGTVALFLDREEAMDTLTQSESRYRALTQTLSAIIWRCQPDGQGFEDISGWQKFTGQTAADSAGYGWVEAIHPDDRAETVKRWEAANALQANYECFYRLRHHDGQFRRVRAVAVPVLNEHGGIREWMGSCEDITLEIEAQEALKTQNRQKDEFLAVLSHELRNPLSAAMMASQLLEAPRLAEGRASQLGQVISRQIVHMSRLVEDLVDVTRITQGLVALKAECVDMAEVVQLAVEQINPMAAAKKQALTVNLAQSPCLVTGDRMRLVQVVANVVGNAARYTPDAGSISIHLAARSDEVELKVVDNGIGLDKDIMPGLFDLFVQAERSTDRKSGGLGLGLALVKSIVEMHGGTVNAASDGRDLGSVFTIRMPRRHHGEL